MAKLTEKTRLARRERILNAAEQCFVRQGFHCTSLQDICREAGISAGAVYVYFESKEALISGICEREKRLLAERIAVVKAANNFMEGLLALGNAYIEEQPSEKVRLQVEINAEALRNPAVAEIMRESDAFVLAILKRMLEDARDAGRIRPNADISAIAQLLSVMGNGIYLRRAIAPDFVPADIISLVMTMVASLVNPVQSSSPSLSPSV